MPQITVDFTSRTIGEKVLFSIDFSLNLASGETITSVVWTCAVEAGSTDPNAAARVSGAPTINGPVVSQLIDFSNGPGTMISGTAYILSAEAVTSLNEHLIGFGHVPSVDAET